ncbi:MAG: NAD-binding protein [Phormidesmis sp.]
MKAQVIVCGLDQVGYRIFLILEQQGVQVVGISEGHSDFPQQRLRHRTPTGNIIVGSLRAEKTLIEAGIREARTLLLASADDALNLAILTQARLLNPHICIVNRLANVPLGERLDRTIPHHVSMSVSALVAPIFAFAAIQRPVIGHLNILGKVWPVTVENIGSGHPLCGHSLSSLWENSERMLLTYEPAQPSLSSQSPGLMAAIQVQKRLEAGDRIIWAELQKAKPSRWSLQRMVSTTLRGFKQFRTFSRAMILVLFVLLATIGIAITAYVTSNHATSVVDALYFSVGMITGAGGQEAVAENSTALVKVFTAVMMLVGAGVIGVFYALLNDYILGTHLQQILMTTRVPQSGHRIVCGLGRVGFRAIGLLNQLGEEVVALEREPQNQFLRAARAQNIPMIVGNAAVPEVLKLANVEKAASLLAITSDDAVNLEIAISAKSIAPGLPVIVRIQDPKFAEQIKQVFKFEHVISPSELTAPAFAAAAIGGRILGNYSAQNGLWLAIATLITPNHPLCDRTLQEAAATEAFTPLYAELNQQLLQGRSLLNMTLTDGVVLYLIMPAQRWDQLWGAKATLQSASY